jgi:hypothetical protein
MLKNDITQCGKRSTPTGGENPVNQTDLSRSYGQNSVAKEHAGEIIITQTGYPTCEKKKESQTNI